MTLQIKPGTATGVVPAPPSKSFAHRALICAALANDTSVLHGISESEDMLATLDCIQSLGAAYEWGERNPTESARTVLIRGGRKPVPRGTVFPCRESGSTLRFLLPLALGKESVLLTGSERLLERGVGIYNQAFQKKAISLTQTSEGIRVQGELTPGEYELPGNVSSQYVSGLLFALPLIEGDSVIRVAPPIESRAYIDMTMDVLRQFGIEVQERETGCFFIRGNQRYHEQEVTVEGDWSNAAALYLFNNLGGNVQVSGLNPTSLQGDRVCIELLEKLREPGAEIDLSNCPDLGPVLFAAAAYGNGGVFTGTRRLRIKESDRAQAMAEELAKFGVQTRVEENRVIVFPGGLLKPSETLNSRNDHRIVMALTALASKTGGRLEGAEAIRKSFPSYFEALKRLGLEVRHEF